MAHKASNTQPTTTERAKIVIVIAGSDCSLT
jgi:hypothetical protein